MLLIGGFYFDSLTVLFCLDPFLEARTGKKHRKDTLKLTDRSTVCYLILDVSSIQKFQFFGSKVLNSYVPKF